MGRRPQTYSEGAAERRRDPVRRRRVERETALIREELRSFEEQLSEPDDAQQLKAPR